MYKDFAQFVFFIKLILFFNFCDIMLYYNNSHGQNEVNQVKKKTLVPLITFLLGICLISLIVYKTDTHEKEQRHITAYSARTAHPFQRNGAPFRFKLSKAQQVD